MGIYPEHYGDNEKGDRSHDGSLVNLWLGFGRIDSGQRLYFFGDLAAFAEIAGADTTHNIGYIAEFPAVLGGQVFKGKPVLRAQSVLDIVALGFCGSHGFSLVTVI